MAARGGVGAGAGGGAVMDFGALLAQVRELLQRQGRTSYRTLKLRFQVDDEALAARTDELVHALRVVHDKANRGPV